MWHTARQDVAAVLIPDTRSIRQLLAESQDGRECFVDAPLLVWREPADEIAKAPGVDGADLLDEDASCLAEELYLRAERRGPGARRCGRDQDHRAGQQLVRLNDHPVAAAALLVAGSSWRAELVNVTPQHACSP